ELPNVCLIGLQSKPLILQANGIVKIVAVRFVAELADYCNTSVRQLQRQFDDATGVSPKSLARTIRFEAIRNRLMFEPDANLTDLAYEFGYTDQAHFINDFKAFTNKTPGEFAAEMRKYQEMLHERHNVVFLQSPPSMVDYTESELNNIG